jgi:hypothetical protein
VRAFNVAGVSAWATPAWSIEITSGMELVYLPLVLRARP